MDYARAYAAVCEWEDQDEVGVQASAFDMGEKLRGALEAAIAARELIAEAQATVREQPLRDGTAIEQAARDYQVDLIAWQIERAADLAEERLAYIDAIQTQEQVGAELARCEADTLHWFRYYAWGFDPRPDSPLQVMPFAAFGFQENYLKWLDGLAFKRREAGLVEKARDMGATVGALNWIVKHWRFRTGFSAMLTSATEDLVDSKKDPDTLFEKVRFALQLFPLWMLPKGFSLANDLTYMNIANPENQSVITGSAPTSKVGRQRRRTVVLMDEFATWPHGGYPQYTALSQTSKTMIALATPEGRFNKYADWRHSGAANVFTMDWREHPWKDKRWLDALPFGYIGAPMDAQQIAQEIERNYDASQPGKVFPQWKEEYCLITWRELVAFYEKFDLADHFFDSSGRYKVPDDWKWGRTHDHGQTKDHPWIVTHAAKPRANYPLHDSLFVFASETITPTGASALQAQPQIEKVEQRLGWRSRLGILENEYEFSMNSHEADGVRDAFATEFGEYWTQWPTDYNVGIPQLQLWLDRIEVHKPNPIRPELSGRARIYFVAEDDEYRSVWNEKTGSYFVTPSKTEHGYKLLRQELPAYHYPETERGKAVKDMRPFKLLDDSIDTLRAFACIWGPTVAELNEQEKINRKLPKKFRPKVNSEQAAEQHPPSEGFQMAARRAYARAEREVEQADISEWEAVWNDTV